ncbi:MAG: T9SS type A sorting domain-containing protein, partial [Ferruginibacter sp.]
LGTLPIRNVSLSGRVDKSKHALNWSITADEAIKNISIETSTDGIRFNTLNTLSNGVATNFNYTPYQHQDLYYRIKVTSVLNQSVYSNTVVLRASSKADQLFTVSTFVTNQITVNAATNFQYQLTDIKGNVISRGNGMQGFNQIDLRNATSGMYVIQLIGNNQQQVERIIKQ